MHSHNRQHDPIQALKDIRNDLKGSHGRYHHQVASVYNQAQQIAGNALNIDRFRRESFWEGIPFPTCILRAAMRFAWDARETNTGDYKAAVFASAALQYYFKDGVGVEEVYDLIRTSGGIEPLYRDQTPHSSARQLQAPSLPPVSDTSINGTLEANTPKKDDSLPALPKQASPGPTMRSAKAKGGGRSGPKQFSRAWCEQRLSLDIDDANLDRLLGLSKGATASVSFVADGPDKAGFLIFRVVQVSIPKFTSFG